MNIVDRLVWLLECCVCQVFEMFPNASPRVRICCEARGVIFVVGFLSIFQLAIKGSVGCCVGLACFKRVIFLPSSAILLAFLAEFCEMWCPPRFVDS